MCGDKQGEMGGSRGAEEDCFQHSVEKLRVPKGCEIQMG